MKKILIINGHPDKESFNWALTDSYKKGAIMAEAEVEIINLIELDFDLVLKYGYRIPHPLEPDLETAVKKMKWADHLVWIFPMWWYGTPALLKAFIDRTFLPGITFKYQKGKLFPNKLLTGKTARIILTADTVSWYNSFIMKNPAINQFKKGVLEFCGIKPVKVTYLAPVKSSTLERRKKWLLKINQLGEQLK
ncbi:flavodoxin family protein [Aquimarina sp. AD10]|uniref:NAD(P)H-dependent oxidoreductase n=1 Tax=Aquimarina sp. AD10 TaxID=1714849 RepID=UPI000E4CA549|nr:NAD(P)H-dependent oxidoreductase [Aquimarina sp. AD10]AXT62387.1 flavodoxin family protein [Aquimarina sp. AD10]RKM90417.1 flavodoxin family protein [Aquimarina sp. AD10]